MWVRKVRKVGKVLVQRKRITTNAIEREAEECVEGRADGFKRRAEYKIMNVREES